MTRYQLLQGDCVDVMRTLPANSVHCVVTSPPYFGLRDYQVSGQIGLEETPEQYVAKLVDVFREVRRLLRDDGTVWLNLGDSYAAARGGDNGYNDGRTNRDRRTSAGVPLTLKPKDLIGIPWRVAFALQADGWYLRQDIIWHKPNPMPESVTDRCTKAHEYVFLLTKAARYWYDAETVKENTDGAPDRRLRSSTFRKVQKIGHAMSSSEYVETVGRNRRSVWTIATQPYSGAHFATFPPKLVEPMILAGCPAQTCPTCGAGWKRVTEQGEFVPMRWKPGIDKTMRAQDDAQHNGNNDRSTSAMTRGGVNQKVTVGFRPSCDCGNPDSVPGVVLDPFNGSGTTGEVAILNGRNYIGVELNPEYIELARVRLDAAETSARNTAGEFVRTAKEKAAGQLALFAE